MKPGIVVAIVLLAIAGAIIGIRYGQNTSTATREPALTEADRQIAQTAYESLQKAAALDERAIAHARSRDVREFAERAAKDHRGLLDELVGTMRNLSSDHSFSRVDFDEPLKSGPSVDKQYLEEFLRLHDNTKADIDWAAVPSPPSLSRFLSSWRVNAARHTTEARQLLVNLPMVSSNLPLLLLVGSLLVAASLVMSVHGRISRNQR